MSSVVNMRPVDAQNVLSIFHLIYAPQPDGSIRDKHGREAPARTIELVTQAMAVLA